MKIAAHIPRTLTLSRREREQRLPFCDFFNATVANPVAFRFVRLEAILHRPKGEGRGEGESRDLNHLN